MRRWLFLALILPLAGWEPLWRKDPDVADGNKAYDEKRYDDAVAAYQRAKQGVDVGGLAYDLGTAMIGQAEQMHAPEDRDAAYAKAMDQLSQAATKSKDPKIRGMAHYNRGNVLMKQKKLDPAIEAYKDALRADSTLETARMNLELALRQRERERKQQQQQQQGQGQQGQQGQGQGQQGQQGGDGQGQQQQGQQGGDGQQGQQQGQGQQQQGQGQGQQGQQGQGGQQGQQSDPNQQGQGGGGQQGQQQQQGGGGGNSTARQPQWPRDDTEYDTPNTPNDQKFGDLEAMSRQLRREQAKARRSSGDTRWDIDKDW